MHLKSGGQDEYNGAVGSLARFVALRSLHLRRAHCFSMCASDPPLPSGLRCGAQPQSLSGRPSSREPLTC